MDLVLNPERFTGYAGASAARVWKSIYEENCFGLSELSVSGASSGSSLASLSGPGLGASRPAGGLSEGLGTEMRDGGDDECVEKRAYYRIISGQLRTASDSRPVLACEKD